MSRVSNKRILESSSESEDKISLGGDNIVENLVIDENAAPPNKVAKIAEEPEAGLESDEPLNDTLPTPNTSQVEPTLCATSTPKPLDNLANLERRLEALIKQHKFRLKQVRQEMKADNTEFLNVVQSELSGETIGANNSDAEPVMHKGRNLMTLCAGPDPSQFGRELAKAIFGQDKNCLLINFMIGSERSKANARPRVELQLERLFTTVVRRKYPSEPEFCLREARVAANQLGLDYKKKILRGTNALINAEETSGDELF